MDDVPTSRPGGGDLRSDLLRQLVPVTLTECRRFVGELHRHNRPPQGWLFGVGLAVGGELVGVAVAGRPIARGLQDGRTIEITRTCTNGTENANSQLYGALCRAAKALGYHRAYTYTLISESGISLKAAGFDLDAELPERSGWDNGQRDAGRFQAVDLFGNQRTPTEAKRRWVRRLVPVSVSATGGPDA